MLMAVVQPLPWPLLLLNQGVFGLTEGLLWYSTGHNNLRKFWFPYSGCTTHVTYDPAILHDS